MHLNANKGYIPITLSHDELVKYLTTQSNIEHAILNGETYEAVEQELISALKKIKFSESFKYGYQYDIYRYIGNE